MKTVLALSIMAFSIYSLMHALAGARRIAAGHNGLAWIFGFLAGILGGAYGMNGPPLVIYGTICGWSPQDFRATLQGYFLPASVVVMGGYWFTGLWVPAVTHYYVMALPGVAITILLGRVLNRRLDTRAFLLYVHSGLIVIGAVLLAQAFPR